MVLSRLAGKLVPEIVGARVRKTEAAAVGQAAKRVAGHLGGLEREVAGEVAKHNAPFARRAPELVAEKYRRMATTPQGFFRGSPQLFYQDLARLDAEALKRGPKALLLGDLHLGNLGAVVKADGKLGWGLVDVDEAAVGSVHAELRRMATSIRLAGTEAGLGEGQVDDLVARFTKAYRQELERLAKGKGKPGDLPKVVEAFLDDAKGKRRGTWLDELAPKGPGGRRFARNEKALEVPEATADEVLAAFQAYRHGLPKDEAASLAGHRAVDVVAPIAGVNSLGRRRYRVLAVDKDGGDALVFELKEQLAPAMAGVVPQPAVASQAGRARQAATALNGHRQPFLGETRLAGPGAGDGTFLVRRLEPWAGSIEAAKLGNHELEKLVEAAGEVVARGHAGGAAIGLADASAILADLGKRKALEQELQAFSRGYAGQVARDHAAFARAIAHDPALLAGRAIARER